MASLIHSVREALMEREESRREEGEKEEEKRGGGSEGSFGVREEGLHIVPC